MSNLALSLVGKHFHTTRVAEDGVLHLKHSGKVLGAAGDLLLISLHLPADDGSPVQGLTTLAELHDLGVFIYETPEEAHDGLSRFEEFTHDR